MRKVFRILAAFAAVTAFSLTSMAEMMPDEPGSSRVYASDNKRYEVEIYYGEGFPSWSLSEDGNRLWIKPMMNEPGPVAVSDNGETIALTLWGWRDEGGSSGVALYDKEGNSLRDIYFKGLGMSEETLRWVRATKISPDGKYLAIGGNAAEGATVTLFNAGTGETVWDKTVGLPGIYDIKISEEAEYVIAATRENNGDDMEFVALDRKGDIFWSLVIGDNLSYDVEHYVRFREDGAGFEVYDLGSGEYTRILYDEVKAQGRSNG